MRIVLAYAGSLEGSAAIQWLQERHRAEVVAVTLDLGQGRELEAIRDRALALGAQRAHVLDARDTLAQEFLLPALRADAVHDGGVPMALALSRPLIARTLVEIAGIEKADAVAHTGRAIEGASRLDALIFALAPALTVLTPAREWALSAEALSGFARRHGLQYGEADALYGESNFWGRFRHRSPDEPAGAFASRVPDTCPAEPAAVDISFTRGIPTALNGVALPLIELVASLGTLAATHGVGRAAAARVACDAPASLLLHAAHRALTQVALPEHALSFSMAATQAYVNLVEQARWYSPLREGLDAFFSAVQSGINGHVRLRLFKGEYTTITSELSQPATGAALRVVPSHSQH